MDATSVGEAATRSAEVITQHPTPGEITRSRVYVVRLEEDHPQSAEPSFAPPPAPFQLGDKGSVVSVTGESQREQQHLRNPNLTRSRAKPQRVLAWLKHGNPHLRLKCFLNEVEECHRARRHAQKENLASEVHQSPVRRVSTARGSGQVMIAHELLRTPAPDGNRMRGMQATEHPRRPPKHLSDQTHQRCSSLRT